MDGYRKTSIALKAMAHPSRLQILEVLSKEEEACVCHMEHLLGIQQAPLSQHLAKLRDANLVKSSREGTNIYYSLADRSIGQLLEITQTTLQLLALQEDEFIGFELPSVDQEEGCRCPRCGQKDQEIVEKT